MELTLRRARLARARLYLVTDSRQVQGDLSGFLDAVLDNGVDIIQLRDKHGKPKEILAAAALFREAADRHGALFIMNDFADLAEAAEADGVHLGQADGPVEFARDILGPDAIIGLSTHDERQMAEAQKQDCDYFTVGPIWETPTKPGRKGTGLSLVRATRQVKKPWFAIGGIDLALLPRVLEAGADRIVVVRAITEARDPAWSAKHLASVLAAHA
jgi:thiamine-phosphate pyrophosphorylase